MTRPQVQYRALHDLSFIFTHLHEHDMSGWMRLSGTFILYAAINALGILFMIIVVPETKGRTLEQIQAAINA